MCTIYIRGRQCFAERHPFSSLHLPWESEHCGRSSSRMSSSRSCLSLVVMIARKALLVIKSLARLLCGLITSSMVYRSSSPPSSSSFSEAERYCGRGGEGEGSLRWTWRTVAALADRASKGFFLSLFFVKRNRPILNVYMNTADA